MASRVPPPPPAQNTSSSRVPDTEAFADHWQDEADAAFLYRELARMETDPARRDVFQRLAEVEDKHVEIWGRLLTEHGRPPRPFRPGGRARLLAQLGRIFGPDFLLPLLLSEEGREVRAYLAMHRSTHPEVAGRAESLKLAKESAEHAETLSELTGKTGEPWHRTGSGGFLRNVVYGFNDGLTANFGLVAGMIGASLTDQHSLVIVAGVAGLVADALSMGASGYLAAKSEQEVYAHEIAMERDEIAMMPEVERDELALIYEAKGMDRASANQLATQVMADPARMLAEKVQEELGIGEQTSSPLREGWITGTATAFGALIPVFPFFFWEGTAALVISFTAAMASHFIVGAGRSVFTGRGILRSGFDMFVVGLGVAAVGYVVGEMISRVL
jgi:vacuolar iron transporter family protein